MAALEAAAQVKMQAAVEERSLKQSGRFRLVADPSMPATAIQRFLQFKQKKDLWSLICPPPLALCPMDGAQLLMESGCPKLFAF